MSLASAAIISRRDLLLLLVQKELKIKYKGAVLGFFWSLLNPILMMIVYSVVFSVIVRFAMPRYPIFLLSGLLPWTAFLTAITSSTTTIVGNAHLVRRVAFPIEFLPLTSVLTSLVNLLPSLGVLLLFAFFFRQPLGLPLLALPLLLALQALLTTGLALILSAVTVYFRDVEYLVGIGLTVLFFMTPILYPLSVVGESSRLHLLLLLNPLTWLVTSYQRIWHDNQWPDLYQLLMLTGMAVLAMIAGTLVFRRLEGRLAEEV